MEINQFLAITYHAPGPRLKSIHLHFLITTRISSFISLQGVFWRSQLYIDQPLFLKFNISLEKDALVGVYGRKGLPPSHTQVGSKKGARLELQLLQIQTPTPTRFSGYFITGHA